MEYFAFEKEFVDKGIPCIPMIVRLKLDLVGIKLKLAQWNRFDQEERLALSAGACESPEEQSIYKTILKVLIEESSGEKAVLLSPDPSPVWQDTDRVPELLQAKAAEFGWNIGQRRWKGLTNLQRFSLIKLCQPGHENRNFPSAMQEFGLTVTGPPVY